MLSPFEWFVVVSLSLCAVLLVIVLIRTSTRHSDERTDPASIAGGGTTTLLSNLSFSDALNFERARNHVESSLLSKLNLGQSGLVDGTFVGIEVLNLVASRELILAKFPEAAQSLLRANEAVLTKLKNGGEALLAKSVPDGKFVAHARKVDPNTLHRLASFGPMVVGAAHMIAGYDNARKLSQISEKLNIVIAARFRDMVAELESVYESIKEQTTPSATLDRTHLLHLSLRLKHLRCAWVSEVQWAISNVNNPDGRTILDKWFLSRNKATAGKIRDALVEQEQPLYLIRFAISLEEMIAAISGEHERFETITLPDVRSQIEKTRALIHERVQWVQKLGPKVAREIQQVTTSLNAFETSLGFTERTPEENPAVNVKALPATKVG